ncbi:transglycosylase domain-containing protein [Microbacterium aurantiacum]|uniref:transglycosylase domain-containing protein n=1 Tax=Microbacterium aurantiacum TaxID=162393 RepID=UPI0015E126D4|nr:transglycosylase domain-containing protein [Microbacterium aurantiacum]
MPQTNRTVKGVLGGLLGLVGLSAVAGLLVTATVTPVLAMTGLAGTQALTLFDELPSNLDPSSPMEQTTFYATGPDGAPFKMASVFEQNRIPVTYEQVAPVMFEAVLSSEDKSFYSHGGVNLGATVKAIVDNVRGTSSRGASTISQQYVKNVLIQECEQDADPESETYADELEQCWLDATNATGSDGIKRKLQEMRFAIQIEKEVPKNDILLGYLNIANFGGTVYGIEAAANYYFSTSAANLTLTQAATLAGMVQNPNYYRIDLPEGTATVGEVAVNSAADGYSKAKDRRDYVLDRLLKDGKITQEQHDQAFAEPITPVITQPVQGCAAAGDNAYFCQYAKSIVENDPAFGATPEERRTNLRLGGMQIYTTLDMRVQQTAIDAVRSQVPQTLPGILVGGTGVSVEASTGRILAMAQNTVFNETTSANLANGESGVVFAADRAHGGGGGFSTGSTYKLFTLLRWLETGHSVNQVLDGRVKTFTPFTICGQKVPNAAKIENFGSGRGGVQSVRQFTASSLNTGFLAMAQQLDLCEINEVAKKLGVHYGNGVDVTQPEFDGDAPNAPFPAVLGSKSIPPLQMAGAYAAVANKGIFCEPKAIDRVVGRDGADLPIPATTCTQQLTPEVAATAAYALRGVMEGGTGSGANPDDGIPVIGKTGTAEAEHTMLVESSTKVTTAVWVGNIQGLEPLNRYEWNGTSLNNVRYGLARDIQGAANDVYGGDSFPEPDGNLLRQVLTNVPNVVDKTVDEATAILEEAGFSVSVGAPVDSDKPANVVAAQDPQGQAPSGGTITISPSNAQGATVPDVKGQAKAAAQAALIAAGFKSISFDKSCNPPEAVVKATSPAAGTAAKKSTPIAVSCE